MEYYRLAVEYTEHGPLNYNGFSSYFVEYRIFWGDLKVCTNNYRSKEKNRGVHFDLGSREIRFWTPLIAGTIHNPLRVVSINRCTR